MTYVRDHPTLQVMGYSRDVGKPNNHEACSLGGAWVGYPIDKFQRKFRRGFTPYAALESFGVAQTEAPPVWLNSVVGAVLGGLGRSWAAGPLRPALPYTFETADVGSSRPESHQPAFGVCGGGLDFALRM